jgi:NAD(P)-dependent dehydrogenase (short-subunit alcohol dehydrogenase family)
MRLKGKVAIVTGAGSGIGQAIAVAFAREGAKVTIADVSLGGARRTASMIRKAGGDCLTLRIDVSQSDQVGHMVERTVKRYKGVDILVNNAGVELIGNLTEMNEEEWDHLMAVNLKGCFLCTRRAIPEFLKRNKGKVINIASLAAFVGSSMASVYSASKGGIAAFTRALAVEYAEERINFNFICPGFVETGMTRDYIANEAMKNYVLEQTPLEMIGRPLEDIAPAAVYLASDESDYMTGQAIILDGGWSVV